MSVYCEIDSRTLPDRFVLNDPYKSRAVASARPNDAGNVTVPPYSSTYNLLNTSGQYRESSGSVEVPGGSVNHHRFPRLCYINRRTRPSGER